MKANAGIILGFALSALKAGGALALGLGNAAGLPVLGTPLRIEIPLIGSEAGIPAIECFSLRPPQAEIAGSYVLRDAQLQVLGEPGRAGLVVSTSSPVREPVLEFAVAVGCGFELSKDYLLLAEAPGKIAPQVLLPLQPAATVMEAVQPAQPKPPAAAPAASPPGESLLRVPAALSLTALARQNYPLQPKAREKFLRMMLLANPGLKSGESLIDGGAELRLPPGLPVRRPSMRPPGRQPAATDIPLQTPVARRPAGDLARSRQDHLVVGAAAARDRNPAELLAEAERLTAVLLEQTQAQEAMVEKIGKLDDALIEVKKHYVELTDRLNRIEAERQAEKLAPKPASPDFLELLLAVLAGGLVGALGLYLFNRRQFQRVVDPVDPSPTASLAGAAIPVVDISDSLDLSPAAKNDFDFCLTAPTFPAEPEQDPTPTIGKVSS